MLRISLQQDTCTITHQQYSYAFTKEFLTPPLWYRLLKLPFRNSYLLTRQQSIDLSYLFTKIQNEKNSNYPFTEALQRTYLIELVHFILKLN